MNEPVFVDTNVLVYRHDRSDPRKQARADDWIRLLVQRRTARTSFQVLQEFYVTLTRKLRPGFDAREAREIVRDLSVWRPVTVDSHRHGAILDPAATRFPLMVGLPHSRRRADL